MSTPMAGLGELVKRDVCHVSTMRDDVPSMDFSTPVVDGGYGGGSKVVVGDGEEVPKTASSKRKKGQGKRSNLFEAIGHKGILIGLRLSAWNNDRRRVLDGQDDCSEGTYMVYGKVLSLRVLLDGFTHDDATFLKVPLWVKFPSLPQRCWTKSDFGKIDSMIGNPICPDQITWDRSRTSYERLLVMVDISQKPVTLFNVNLLLAERISQKVEYELFPGFCCHCRTYDHNFFCCELLNPPVVDVGLEPPIVPDDDQAAREDVLVEVLYWEVAGFVREGLSYSETVFSNLDPVGDIIGDNADEAEDSGEELGPDDDEARVSEGVH
ncbi:hypothetical protein LIER_10792 [Lithospermum erythrorhizon]|uniref:DUF4283 domain-containing protein n=1 Tax=Lithospermum erythrorhizon TaxID=34254 RepID=A0AAV3PLY4_LITER